MRKAGIKNYQNFAKAILRSVKTKPISFEVFSDDFKEMEIQAKKIASWGKNVHVKIPITNTKGQSSFQLIKNLSAANIPVNVTAVFTTSQVKKILPALSEKTPAIISIFAGRIADSGRDPMPTMKKSASLIKKLQNVELLWASPRQPLDIILAKKAGCQIITVFPEIISRLDRLGKNLNEFSLETVEMFYEAAKSSGYNL